MHEALAKQIARAIPLNLREITQLSFLTRADSRFLP